VATGPLFESQSNQADADQPYQVYLPFIAKTPPIPPLSPELVQEAYQFYSLGDPVPPTSLRFEFKPNLNNPDQPPIIFARDAESNKVILATRFNPETEEQEWHVAKLRDLADAVGLRVGTNLLTPYVAYMEGVPDNIVEILGDLVVDNFNHAIVDTIEWWQTEEERGVFTFDKAERAIGLARRHNMTIDGHSLIFPPSAFQYTYLTSFRQEAERRGLTPEQMRQELINIVTEHVTNVVNHFRGQVDWWDVVVEANPTGDDDEFMNIIGPEYIDIAFELAREIDPNTPLDLEDCGEDLDYWKYGFLLETVSRLQEKGLIDALKVECHLDGANPIPKEELVEAFRSYGLPIIVSSVDITLKNVSGARQERFERQAQILVDLFEAAMDSGVCIGFYFWEGFGDKYNWLERMDIPGYGGPNADATIFDDDLNPKPAYFALKSKLQEMIDQQ
jgi:endo-1,4-beta-xylanase